MAETTQEKDQTVSSPDTTSSALGTMFKQYPILKDVQKVGEEAAEAKVKAKSLEEGTEARLKKEALQKISTEDKAYTEAIEKQLKPLPDFKPSQENIADLGQIFSLIATMGVALGGSGKMSGLNAMNAMGGMMEGYRKGRKDLFDKEQATFEKELQSMKAQNDVLIQKLERYNKLRVTDKEAAMQEAAEIKAMFPGIQAANIEAGKTDTSLQLAYKGLDLYKTALEKSAKQGLALNKLSPLVRGELQKNYPDYDFSKLAGLKDKEAETINFSIQSIKGAEHIAEYIKDHPESIGGTAKLRNLINLDAIKSVVGDTQKDALDKAAILDGQIDDAVAKNKITYDEAKSAKILNKMIFSLALSDVRSSGQRGSIYLDKKFQEIYDQASRIDTFSNILYERARESNERLQSVDMDVANRSDPENFELTLKGGENWANTYFPLLTPNQIKDGLSKGTIKNGQWFRGTDGRVRQINMGAGAQ